MQPFTESVRRRLLAIVEQYQSDVGACHRVDHTVRVVDNARQLASAYPTADPMLLEIAAWLHDIGRGVERQKGVSHADASAEMARPLLLELGCSPDQIMIICEAIADHRFSARRQPRSIEGQLLQDADRLDALGAVGIARTFAEGGMRTLFEREDPFCAQRTPDDTTYSLDHFYVKLLTLPETMHTDAAKNEAHQRVAFMQSFLRQLERELRVPR